MAEGDEPLLKTDDYQINSDEMKMLDEIESIALQENVYSTNRTIFLLQSVLLGLSYAMIWPTLWVYIEDEFQLSEPLARLVYGATYIAYPIASMISAHVVERIRLDTKKMILVLNVFEIAGSLIYTAHFFPLLPVIGRFVAGLGDAFYVVLMKDMKSKYSHSMNEKMTIECLAAFIIGVILAPGINIVTTFLHFQLGNWKLNSANYPGLTIAVLFFIMQFFIAFFMSENDDNTTVVEPPTENEVNNKNESNHEGLLFSRSSYKVILIIASSFAYTYIVASMEISIPIILRDHVQANDIAAMLLYVVIATLYAMILVLSMTVSFKHQLEVFLGTSLVAQVAGMFALIFFQSMYSVSPASIMTTITIVLCVTTMWANDDILYINYVQILIPINSQEPSHKLRKVVSKIAFALAGITTPFWLSNAVYYVAPPLIVFVVALFVAFVVIRF